MLRFRAFASSSLGNLYTVSDGTTTVAIEAGLPIKRIRRALDWQVSKLAGALVSHSHGDHACGARELMRAGVNVYALKETFEDLGIEGHRARPVKARETFHVGTLTVTPFELVHDVPCIGFMVSGGGDRLVYISDTAYCPVRFLPPGVIAIETNWSHDILRTRIEEGEVEPVQWQRTVRNHLSLERAIELLQANDLSRLREVYLLHLSGGNSNEQEFKRAVEAATGVPARIAVPVGG